ncbi:Fc.00g087470.m01.CDS01 [Cosmosporella sp. VM-42]
MLEYFTTKKLKKNKVEKEAAAAQQAEVETKDDQAHATGSEAHADDKHHDKVHDLFKRHSHDKHHRSSSDEPPLSPVLDQDDQAWLQSILNNNDPAPPLPPRVKTPDISISDSDGASSIVPTEEAKELDDNEDTKGKKKKEKKGKEKEKKDKDKKDKEEKHPSRISMLFSRKKHGDTLTPEDADVAPKEAEREENDLINVLTRLNLSAKNNKAISLSEESSDLLQRFTNIFKDLVNGVPTAYQDLAGLIEDRDGAINRGFEKLPSSLKKLVTQLPDKLTSTLAPELLAAAAESQGLKMSAEAGMKESAKAFLTPSTLTELVTKPGAVVSMLKAIVNALKVRWPAFIGTNVIWSVALFLLMFVLWYCHKRGREVRLEREKSEADVANAVDGSDRIEELPDDPMLLAPAPAPEPIVARDVETKETEPVPVLR